MVDKGEFGAIGVQVNLSNGVARVKWIKILVSFQTKKVQNTVVHISK